MYEGFSDDAFRETEGGFYFAKAVPDAASELSEGVSESDSPADLQADTVGEASAKSAPNSEVFAKTDDEGESHDAVALPPTAPEEEKSEPALADGDDGSGNVPPSELTTDDGDEEGDDADGEEVEYFGMEDYSLTRPRNETVESAAEFFLDNKDNSFGRPLRPDTAATFKQTIREWAEENADEDNQASQNNYFVTDGPVSIRAGVKYVAGAKEDAEAAQVPTGEATADVELFFTDRGVDPSEGVPLARYSVRLADGAEEKRVGEGREESVVLQPSDREVLDLLSIVEGVREAHQVPEEDNLSPEDRRLLEQVEESVVYNRAIDGEAFGGRRRVAQPSREVPDTALNELLKYKPEVIALQGEEANYYPADIERFITDHPGILKTTEHVEPVIDPDRPDYWVRGLRADDAMFSEEPVNAGEAAGHLEEVKKEFEKLGYHGAVVPKHTHFLVQDQTVEKLMVFTAAEHIDAGGPLWPVHEDIDINPALLSAHERAAVTVFGYLRDNLLEQTVIEGISHPSNWGMDGKLYNVTPRMVRGWEALRNEFVGLAYWLDELPYSERVEDLTRETERQLEALARILGEEWES